MSEHGTPTVRATLRAHAVVMARITYAELAAAVVTASRMGLGAVRGGASLASGAYGRVRGVFAWPRRVSSFAW